MKTIRNIHIMLLSLATVLCACERTLDFKGPEDEAKTDLTLNAAAIAGSPLTAYLSRAYTKGKAPSIQYYDYEHALFFKDDLTTDYLTDDYLAKTTVRDAEVTAEVNGQESYPMAYDGMAFCYTCSYVPVEGDRIVLRAKADGREVSAEAAVPAMPRIEVLGYEVLPENPYQNMGGLVNQSDTIMRLTCRITDDGGENYYRLRVRSERKGTNLLGQMQFYIMQDIFFSDDDLFLDEHLTSNFGGWPAYFSNIFDNSRIEGANRTFVIDSPKASSGAGYMDSSKAHWGELPDLQPRVMVELQAISYDLYRYLKSVQLYRMSQDDRDAEPTLIYSNVDGGWGIFGALSYDRHFVEYGE